MTYVNRAKETGKRSPVIEAMLQNMGRDEEKNQKVQVLTGDGTRVVSLAEAMDKFSGQLQSGQAKFVGGAQAGKDVSAYTGGEVDATKAKKGYKESKRSSDLGVSAAEYYKDHPDENPNKDASGSGWTGTKVIIDLSPAAQKLLSVQGYSPAAAGEPPMDNPFEKTLLVPGSMGSGSSQSAAPTVPGSMGSGG